MAELPTSTPGCSALRDAAPLPLRTADIPSREASCSERNALVEAFVVAQSAVFIATRRDEPGANWVHALPPATEHMTFERCVDLLGRLLRLHGEVLDPLRVCHIRSRPLFDSLADDTEKDFEDMQFVGDYLQLPKALIIRVLQHRTALLELGGSCERGDRPLAAVLRSCASLAPLLEAARRAALALAGYNAHVLAILDSEDSFVGGLCGDEVPASSNGTDAAASAAVGAAAGATAVAAAGAGAAAGACTGASGRDSDVAVWNVIGRIIAGHSLPRVASRPPTSRHMPCEVAAATGRLESLQALLADDWPCAGTAVVRAAGSGHVHVLEWLHECARIPWCNAASRAAATGGHLPVLQWAVERRLPLDETTVCCAAGAVDPAAMHWLIEKQRLRCRRAICHCLGSAAGTGDISRLQYLRDHHRAWGQGALYPISAAAAKGFLNVVQWARSDGCPWDSDACRSAAAGGCLQVLQWMRSQEPPCPWNEDVCTAAAGRGDLESLQWLRSQSPPCDWDEDCCIAAARGGHLRALQWLRAQEPPCPWNCYVVSRSHALGHVEVAAWATENGCPQTL